MKIFSLNVTQNLFAIGLTFCCISGCTDADTPEPLKANVVEVSAVGLELHAPDEIPSGWTTFRFSNESPMIHFAVVERMPEGYGQDEQQDEIAPVFQDGMNLLVEGDVESALAKFGELPEWFGGIVFKGGPGLLSPGLQSESVVYLEPGTYILECYIKTEGIFHSYNPDPAIAGMVHEFTVTSEANGYEAPTPSIEITISTGGGIVAPENVQAGDHIVAVHFADQTVHENFLGHDVHVAKIDDMVRLDELAAWMDWSQPLGLQTPAPVAFLGGTQEMPAGETAYFTVHLEPAQYVWISEVSNPDGKGMLVPFSVDNSSPSP